MNARLHRWGAILFACSLLPGIAHADWNEANDEANRQRMMAEMRANDQANDRANEESQRRQQAAYDARQSGDSSSSGRSSSASAGGGFAPYRSAPEGPHSTVATYSFTIHTQESEAQTFARIEREAAAGQIQSQFNLGRIYYTGYGVGRSDAKAIEWFAAAADKGHAAAQAQYGVMLYYGQGGPADKARGLAYLKKAADQGDRHGEGVYGALALAEAGDMAQPQTVDLLVRAADNGELVAQNTLGRVVYPLGYGAPADPAKAVKYLKLAAAQNDPSSMFDLGVRMLSGAGVSADEEQGLSLMRASALAGYPDAQAEYGFIQVRGAFSVTKDLSAGLRLLQEADRSGSATGSYYLGLLTMDGRGVSQDTAAAIALYKRAAEKGQSDAQARYGMALIQGDGVSKDVAAGAEMIQASAKSASMLGQEFLARLYYDGVGVPQDRRLSAGWFTKAAKQGDAAAIEALKTDPALTP